MTAKTEALNALVRAFAAYDRAFKAWTGAGSPRDQIRSLVPFSTAVNEARQTAEAEGATRHNLDRAMKLGQRRA